MNAKHFGSRIARLFVLAAPLALGACDWFTDFKRQPSLWTWEPVHCDSLLTKCDSTVASRHAPQFSVPTTGTAVAGFQVSYTPSIATVDSMSSLVNPTPPTEASLENGHKYFQINCAVCHGDLGKGDGPVTKYGMPPMSIVGDATKARSDGYIFGMIRNGRGLMPPYNRIEEMDRWDVVNYVRGLQGTLGRQVATGPLAPPGVTGDKLPRATRLAPTQPSQYRILMPSGREGIDTAAATSGAPGGHRVDTTASHGATGGAR